MRRRHVVRVGIAYVVVSTAVGAAAETFLPNLGAPGWVLPTLLGVLVLGLPVALVLAWAYEVTPEGIVRDTRASAAGHAPPETTGQGDVVSDERRSIVVLPFDNMSPDPADAYFSDGLTEEIITQLSYLKALRVISRNSAMALKDTRKDTREIGQQLNVQYVMEGSVRRAGNDLRITAQLIDARTDAHLWAETYDRKLRDVFRTQSEIALQVSEALHASLTPEDERRVRHRPTKSLGAHEHYLLGRHHWWKFTPQDMWTAKEHFDEALALDPDYALAHSGIAYWYLVTGGGGVNMVKTSEAISHGKAAAHRAIVLDPDLGEAYGTLALLHHWYEWDWDKAQELGRVGVEVDPNSSMAWGCYAHVLAALGRAEESIHAAERFVELDPLHGLAIQNAAIHCFHAGERHRAKSYLERLFEVDPDNPLAPVTEAYMLLDVARIDEALVRLEGVGERIYSENFAPALLGYALGRAGRTDECEAVIDHLTQRVSEEAATWTEVGMAALGLGDEDRTLSYLEREPDQRPPGSNSTTFIGVTPIFDPLRSEPRFQAVLERLGLGSRFGPQDAGS